MRKLFALLLSIYLSASVAMAATIGYGIGSQVTKNKTTGMQMGAANTEKDITVIEYDTYGAETAYYIDDGHGTTTKYDKYGRMLSHYKTGQTGRTYIYDKYNHVMGYFQAISPLRTNLYNKMGELVGYFQADTDGYIKKYDIDGTHLNTYKKH